MGLVSDSACGQLYFKGLAGVTWKLFCKSSCDIGTGNQGSGMLHSKDLQICTCGEAQLRMVVKNKYLND